MKRIQLFLKKGNLKKGFLFFITLFSLFYNEALLGTTTFYRNNDFHLWALHSFEKKVCKDTDFFLSYEGHFGDEAQVLYLTYVQALMVHQFYPWLKMGAGYRQLWAKVASTGRFVPVASPIYEFTIDKDYKKCKIFNRSRFQYLIHARKYNRQDQFEWRHRIDVVSKRTIFKRYTPYISDEVFLLHRSGFVQNRFLVGLKFGLPCNHKSSLFYMLRHIKIAGNWTHQHVLGTYFYFTLDKKDKDKKDKDKKDKKDKDKKDKDKDKKKDKDKDKEKDKDKKKDSKSKNEKVKSEKKDKKIDKKEEKKESQK